MKLFKKLYIYLLYFYFIYFISKISFHVHSFVSNTCKLNNYFQNLKEFITDAPNGFIYMSLGTNVMISSLPEHVQIIFRDVFASLPYKVLWKHDGNIPNKPDNIYIAKWFPQQSVLGKSI